MDNLPTAQAGFHGLSAQQQKDHRSLVGVRAKAILSGFWQEQGRDDVVEAMELQGWMDVLEVFTDDEIRKAWASYQTNEKNRSKAGRLVRPDAGAIRNAILLSKPLPPRVQVAPPVERSEPRVSADAATEIMKQAGFRPKMMGDESE